MDKRYSEMTQKELMDEIGDLKVKAQKAEQMGMVNEYAVHERKITMAQAYMMDPSVFNSGDTYLIRDSKEDTFKISYMNGVFAWGYRNNSNEEEALPISLLTSKLN
ncbi:YfhH family protein [Evansella sp. AB-P1]|uniref:YfhH family protein n=1 Tax=Evansella sp. AB-P1 TaxID=3037653 RepID=UPI00241F7C7B|nr:YfhH family protein [Evansella sp. AB-P1]MDG5786235.1 YfhH family protein [Evansella sp. AB-P1]